MQPAINEEMTLYESPGQKTKKEALNLRVPDSLRAMLNDTVKLWKMLAEARGEDSEQIDLTYVAVRLLKVGADTAFGEFGVKLIDESGKDKGKLRPALDSGEKDKLGHSVTTVVSASEWKHVSKVVKETVGQ